MMMNRTPIKLRSSQLASIKEAKGNKDPTINKTFVKENRKEKKLSSLNKKTNEISLNETFITDDVLINEKCTREVVMPLDQQFSEGFLNKEDVKKLPIEDQIILVVNRAIDISNAFYNLKEKYEKDIHELKDQNLKLKEDNQVMKEKLRNLQSLSHSNSNYERIKQELKNDECEFWGVEEENNENLLQTVINVAKKFKVDLSPDEISYVTRKKMSTNTKHGFPRTIRIKLYNKRKRDQLIETGKSMRIPRQSQVDEKNGRSFIYINEALTNHFEYLYGKARELKRKNIVNKTWCKAGKIFIQWGTTSPKLIENLKDFDELN